MINDYNEKLIMAVQLFKKRNSGKIRPDGTFDSNKIFVLSQNEKCECCRDIIKGNVRYPLSALKHACSKVHVANLCNVSVNELKSQLRKQKRHQKQRVATALGGAGSCPQDGASRSVQGKNPLSAGSCTQALRPQGLVIIPD